MRAAYPIDHVAALLPFVSTEETRYYLNGVHLEPDRLAIATDGHSLAAWRSVDAFCEGEATVSLPTSLPKSVKYQRNWLVVRDRVATIVSAPDAMNGEGVINNDKLPLVLGLPSNAVIDGTYPDWRRIVPAGTGKIEAASINPLQLAKLTKLAVSVGKIRKSPPPPIVLKPTDETDAAPILFGLSYIPDLFGIVMPMARCGKLELPKWSAAA
jgi:DNA polymerase-3 subunit beta